MSELIISEQRKKAVELNQKIIISAELAQQHLWDMCVSLKTMRDDKLYKELGYSNFEDYCENEVGIKRRNAYNYISIVEKINPENVQSIAHFGMTKLSLLATISEQEQQEISEKVDLESTTVKELKKEIDKLKDEKRSVENDLRQSQELGNLMRFDINNLKKKRKSDAQEIENLKATVEELENRPIEVAVAEPSDNERRLNETLRALERENMKRNDELEAEYRENEKIVRKQLEDEKQEALLRQKEEYEEKLKKLQTDNSGADDEDVFKAYFSIAYDSFNRMLEFTKQSKDKEFFKSKVEHLIETLATQNINL